MKIMNMKLKMLCCPPALCGLQIVNPLHMWQLWDPEVRHQRKCLAKHNLLMGEKVKRLRENPPAPHTIAGMYCTCSQHLGIQLASQDSPCYMTRRVSMHLPLLLLLLLW